MQRVKLGLVCLTWLCLASAVSAQTELDPAANSGIATVQNVSGSGLLNGTYFDVRHVIGDGVGYQNSYSQIGVFTPFWINEDAFIAPNARLIVTNSTQTGGNVGGLGRVYVNNWDRILGVYGYYDNDQDSRNFRYNQFTIGGETLGQWWDARANGYFVTGNDTNFISNLGIAGNPFFFGNSIGFLGKQLRDQALSGADAEFGMPLAPTAPWLRGYGGIYGYRADSSNVIGVRGRLEAMVSNDLTLGVTVTQDAIYGTNINGTIDFKFSGFQPTRYFPNLTTRQRMLNPVQRNWRIATRTAAENVDVAARNPETGKPYFIVHVDNSKPAGGDGTIEHPFKHLVNAPQADVILVHRGNATSAATAVTGSTILSNNERLLGDGLLQTIPLFAQFGASAISGTFNIPGTSNTGIYPYVTNPAGSIVTLANNNEVSALNLVNSAGNAIQNTAAGSRNFFLHNLEISGNAGKGIDLNGASGVGVISSINVGAADHFNPFGLGNNAAGGIQVSTASSGLYLQLSNVYMNAGPAGAQAYGVSLTADNGPLNANFNNVFTNGNVNGILLTENSQQLNATMNFVRSEGNTGTGIAIAGTGGSIAIDGTDVGALNNGGDNLDIGTQAAPIVTSTVGITFNDSNFSNSATGSGIVFSLSGGFGTLNLPNSVGGSNVSGNAVDGLGIFATNGTLMNANVQDGAFSGNGRDAFHVEADLGSIVNLAVDPTDASRSGRDGLYFAIGQDSVLNTMFVNDNLNNSGSSAVFGTLDNFATLNLFFDQTSGRNSGADGFSLTATNNSVANVEVDHGTFAGSGKFVNGSSAITISSDNSRVNLLTNLTLGNNIAESGLVGNQAYGLTLNIANSSVFTGNIYNGDFTDTLVDAVNANVTGSSNASLTLLNTSGSRSGLDGFAANVDNSVLATSLTNSDFNLSARNGMNYNIVNGGQLIASFDNTSISNSGQSGIFAIVDGAGSVANLVLMNNSFVNSSGASGLDFNVNAGDFNVTALSSSFSNSGVAGVTGSGVLGVVDNGGVTRLDFINTQVNNNLDNGIFVTTTNGSSVQAAFSIGAIANNGIGVLTPHNNDGILLQMDNSGFSSLTVSNNAEIVGNGNDGIAIVASNFTNFQGVFDTVSIVNNGTLGFPGTGAGFDIATTSNSQVDLNFNGVTIGNSFVGGPQVTGLLSTTNTGGLLTASLVSTDLSNNQIDAINAAVDSGATANFNLINVKGDNSFNTGALFEVSGGGTLTVAASLGSSFSAEGGSGILAQVDGAGSTANFALDTINLTNNGAVFGGQGFTGLATNGGTLNACIDTSVLSNNANQGIELIAANAGSTINFNVTGSTIDFNSGEGLLISVSDQAAVNYRSQNTTYDGNGLNGALDGVSVTAIGNGAADSATALILLSGGSVNDNTGNGIALDAENGATMTAVLNSVQATGNAAFGLTPTATGANTKFSLLMTGNNDLSGNTSGPISPLVFSNMDQIVLDISGTFNGSPGDGVHIDLQNINNAVVAVTGPGTINGSTGDGINISLLNVNNGSVLIDGVTEINGSGNDGIRIAFDTVAQGAISIIGPTDVVGSAADGIDVSVANSTLVDNLSFGAASIQLLTLTDNLNVPPPLNGCLPAPVTFTLDSTGLVSVNALLVDSMSVNASGNTGVNILATNSTISTLTLQNNIVATANGALAGTGDTIHVDMTNTPITTLNVLRNQVGGAALNGMNFDLNNSPITTANISGNTIGLIAGGVGNAVDDSLPVIVPGFTANTLAANDDGSTGLIPLGFNVNYFGTPYTGVFVNNNGNVTFNGPLAAFTPFSLLSTAVPIIAPFFADVDTRSGNPVTYGTGTIAGHNAFGVDWLGVDHFSALGGGNNGLPQNSFQLVMIDRSDIAPGDFDFEFNYQSILWESGTASGGNSLGLGGSSARAGWSNGVNQSQELAGSAVNGALLDGGPAATALIHNSLNSTHDGRYIFFVRNGQIGGPSPSGLDGIRLNATNGSDIGTLNVNANDIENAGKHGIDLIQANSNINNQTYFGNTIANNGLDGIHMVNPTTTNNTITAAFTQNNINTNGGTGINLSLVTGAQNLQASFASNTVSSNKAEGINIQLADNSNMTGGFDGNTINLNTNHGINFNMGVNGVITSNFTNNTIDGNKSDGINIALNTGGHFEGAVFTGNQIGSTGANLGNGGMGVRLTVPDTASFNWNLGDTTGLANSIAANVGSGVGISMTGASTGTLNVANSSFTNTKTSADPTFSGDGLTVSQSGTSTLTGSIVASTFTNNADDGAKFTVPGNNAGAFAQLNNLTVGGATAALGNTFNNNGGNGLEFLRTADGEISNVTIDHNTFNSNTLNGLFITAANKLRTDNYDVNNNDFSLNGRNGILLSEQADAQILINMNSNNLTNNGTNGLQIVEQVNASSDNRSVSGTWTQNVFTGNARNGIAIDGATGQALDPITSLPVNLTIGDATDVNLGNLIANNTLNGIEVSGAGNLIVGSNEITNNGTLSNLLTANENAGILMNVAPFSNIVVENNLISNNFGDGVQYQIAQGFNGFASEISIHDNVITNNNGRGINMINRGSNETIADISNNSVTANGLEGVYIVNTASTDQAIWASSTTPLVADGSVFQNGNLLLHMVGNQIIGNGINSSLAGTGLVIRAGTNDGGRGPNDTGGFASTGGAIAQGADFNTFLASVNPQRGGIVAQIDNNLLGGNFGNDIEFHSFTSTVAPITAAGTWDATTFTITAYQSDPLSRFDLYFRGNTVDPGSADLNGGALGGYGARNPLLVAFYNDSDGVFKSRLNTATPPGPFTSAVRARNATRQAAFIPFFNQPAVGPHILYPGIGASTWRVSNDSIDNTTFFFNGFNVDVAPYTNTGDARGIFLNNPPGNGELPYGYGSF